jgi:hypothetical protein
MKKFVLALSALVVAGTLAGCDYFGSPEQKAFEQFVAKCKANPAAADCKAWEESKKPAGGN